MPFMRKLTDSILLHRILMALVLSSVEAFLAILCLMSGIPILVNPQNLAPNSILALLPAWAVLSWSIGLVVGGSTTLVGIMLSEYRVERMGVLVLMGLTTVFSIALTAFLPNSLITMLTFILFGLAMYGRYWILGKLLKIQKKRYVKLLEDLNGSD